MNEFADILNLFIANVIAYTFFVAVYGFIIYNVGKIIFYLNTAGGRDFSAACFVERTIP